MRTFGVPDGTNQGSAECHSRYDARATRLLVNMASTDPQAELIFYYSGHGNNDEATKEPYLLPVDITGKNIRLGISLSDLYKKLATYPVKGAYVIPSMLALAVVIRVLLRYWHRKGCVWYQRWVYHKETH